MKSILFYCARCVPPNDLRSLSHFFSVVARASREKHDLRVYAWLARSALFVFLNHSFSGIEVQLINTKHNQKTRSKNMLFDRNPEDDPTTSMGASMLSHRLTQMMRRTTGISSPKSNEYHLHVTESPNLVVSRKMLMVEDPSQNVVAIAHRHLYALNGDEVLKNNVNNNSIISTNQSSSESRSILPMPKSASSPTISVIAFSCSTKTERRCKSTSPSHSDGSYPLLIRPSMISISEKLNTISRSLTPPTINENVCYAIWGTSSPSDRRSVTTKSLRRNKERFRPVTPTSPPPSTSVRSRTSGSGSGFFPQVHGSSVRERLLNMDGVMTRDNESHVDIDLFISDYVSDIDEEIDERMKEEGMGKETESMGWGGECTRAQGIGGKLRSRSRY